MKTKARVRPAKGKVGKVPEGPDRRATIIFLVMVICTAVFSYEGLYWILRSHLDDFTTTAITSFSSFLLIPGVLLSMRIAPKRKFDLGKFDGGFLISLAVYLVFGVWIIAYYSTNPYYFKKFDLGSSEFHSYIILVALYVMPVDFLTRRVIQFEMSEAFGPMNGFWAGTAAWIVGHVLEFVWLQELMGPAGSTIFLVVSGLVTGLLYMRYKNVLALMVGHWAINIMITVVTSQMH